MFSPQPFHAARNQAEPDDAGDDNMPFEIKACSINNMHRHPVLPGRTLAQVKVMLREIRSKETFDHDLTLKVWADTDDGMSPSDVKTALLAKAAAILKRTVSVAEIQMNGDGSYSRLTPSG